MKALQMHIFELIQGEPEAGDETVKARGGTPAEGATEGSAAHAQGAAGTGAGGAGARLRRAAQREPRERHETALRHSQGTVYYFMKRFLSLSPTVFLSIFLAQTD